VIFRTPEAEGLPSLGTLLQEAGWHVALFSTPMVICPELSGQLIYG
jgi:hypothetical protein